MASGRDRKLMSGSSTQGATICRTLSRDELCELFRRQINGRNKKLINPEFHRILAEEVATSKIGEFHYGEQLLNRDESPELRAKAEKFDLIESPEYPYRMTGGPVETMVNPCQCADLTHLTIQGAHLSGSKLEGSDVRLNGNPWEWSDIDVMLQLGPVEALDGDVAGASSLTLQRNECITFTPEVVSQKGFYLLYHTRLPSCRHSERILFSGRRLRKKLLHVIKMTALAKGNLHDITFEGPSIASTDRNTSADIVTCVSFPPWPSAEFASRKRPSHHPSTALISRLRRTPALLVPVGSAGSPTKEHEWRLSFSRHEFLAHRVMPRILRDCLAVLKYANAVINGPHGAMKGFQLKTSVLWLAELRCEEELERLGFFDCLLMVLQFVDDSASRGRLDCYFFTEINLLGGRTREDLAALHSAIQLTKKHLETALRVLVALMVWYDDSGVLDVRLPRRKISSLYDFIFPETSQKQRRANSGPAYTDYSVPGTWMSSHTVFAKLFSLRSPTKELHDKVLEKLKMGEKAEREQVNREWRIRAVRWTDEC